MKSNRMVMNTKTIAVSMLQILMSSWKQTTGFMVTSHIPISSDNQANLLKQDSKEKKHSDKSMKQDSKSWKELTMSRRDQNSRNKLCFPLVWMMILIAVKDTWELYSKREVMCISICNVATHYFKKEECKEVTSTVYSFVTTSQGYPNVLSCNLKKHVSWLSDDVIMECNRIH